MSSATDWGLNDLNSIPNLAINLQCDFGKLISVFLFHIFYLSFLSLWQFVFTMPRIKKKAIWTVILITLITSSFKYKLNFNGSIEV